MEIAAVGKVLTVTNTLCEFTQPFELVVEYVTATVPALTPVTNPLAPTVATAAFAELQTGLFAVVLSKEVDPTQTVGVPVMAEALGKLFTLTTVGADVLEHPLAPVTVTV